MPQTDPTGSWFGSHNLTNFLPPQSMMPLSTEPDIIIPTKIPIQTQKQEYLYERKPEYKQDIRFVSNVCLEQPELYFCKKRPKLKELRSLKP